MTLVASGALPEGVSLGTTTTTRVTIEDDDAIKAIVAAVAPTVTEGGVAEFTVTLTGAISTADVMVSYTLGGTATAGTDYTAPDRAVHRRGRRRPGRSRFGPWTTVCPTPARR